MQCPGQDSRYWDGEAIFESHCPKCGNTVEFFKDDSKRRCKQCGHEVLNPRIDFGCASYCPHAEQCLGSLPPEMLAQKQELMIDRVAIEMKHHYGDDFKKIGQATKVARHAGQLVKTEEGNKAVTLIAAYLHDMNGVTPVREILTRLAANQGLIDEVCEIIDHLHRKAPLESTNYKVVHDAIILNDLTRAIESGDSPEAVDLLTISARKEAEKLTAPTS